MSLTTYNFYNKDWFIAAQVVKEHKLSSNYNTYYSNYYSNARLYGPVPSFEFRLSGVYLNEFKSLYGANSPSIVKSSAIWLIDEETVKKLLNKDIINSKEKTVKTVESNGLSIQYNLGVSKEEEANKHATLTTTDANLILNKLTQEQIANDISKVKQDFRTAPFTVTNNLEDLFSKTYEQLTKAQFDYSKAQFTTATTESPMKQLADDIISGKATFVDSTNQILPITTSTNTYSPYSEEDISDAITLISSKLTNTPYQQEKILDGGSIRLDLFTCTRRSVYAIELKKNIITLDHVKEKLDNKNYLKHIMDAYSDLNITFIFSSPKGITFDALMYLQEASRSIGEHKVIYKPTSNLLLDMINKKEKDLPSYYYKQILDKPIIKYLLQVN